MIDQLGSDQDRMWASAHWPELRLAPDLRVGAPGGHGPIRYYVEELVPGRRVRFRFTAPTGFDGYHEFALEEISSAGTKLTHVLQLSPRHVARLSWPLVFRYLHDALIEDTLDRAEAAVSGNEPSMPRWTRYVRLLRWLARPRVDVVRHRSSPQVRHGRVEGGVTSCDTSSDRLTIRPTYVDRFALTTDISASPRQWAVAALEEGLSRADRDRVFQMLLGMRTAQDAQSGSIAGWAIASEGRDDIVLAAAGSGTSANLLIEGDAGWVQLTTALTFTSPVRALIWRVLSRVHRREVAPTLRTGARLLEQRAAAASAPSVAGHES
ncbi:hypothetical protein KUV85_14575 [Nocardioides panacisoli]|uniref:hypothetical protein n=1 Tax=Nocardioides panacisoli TaxID=627624 RepID=UPI001C634404|nr:hypothetical protein [Nocardioides panacisoli]QYJ03541.1 hypothetical protein KUV85_14575 [Nocardioides panacisoli]